jgi:hypothetical protein
VNVLFNNIGTEQAQALANILKEHPTLKSLCGNKGNETELDMSGELNKQLGAEGAIMLAPEIMDNGALLVLSLKDNSLYAAGAKVLGEGLKGNQSITVLDLSDNRMGKESRFTIDMSGVITLVDAIGDMGALSVTNVMGNYVGKEQLSKLQEIMHSKPNLVSLCGIAGDATEADLSGLGMDADDAVVLASELPDKGAMTSLNLASNALCGVDGHGNGTFDATGIWLHHHCCSFLNNTCSVSSLPG